MIAEGTCKARPTEAALGNTEKSGSETVAVGFILLDGPDEGKHVTWYGYFTEKTEERTLDSLRYCGWQGDNLADLSSIGVDANVSVYLVIEHEQDQEGEMRARVRWVNSGGGVALKNRMNPGEAASFAQRMRGKVIAHAQRGGKPASSTGARPNGAAPPATRPGVASGLPGTRATGALVGAPKDDDIPF